MSASAVDLADEARPGSPPPGRSTRPRPQPFGPESMLWDLSGQRLYVATSACAFVLQVMHPAIGTVVDQRSSFRTDPWGRAARSFDSVQTWIYGGQEAIAEGQRLRQLHKSLNATDAYGVTHRALTPEPWAWVPLTGFWAFTITSKYFLPEPLSEPQLDQMYAETLNLCRILQVPERMLPQTRAAYWAYFDDMVDNVLVDHPVAREVIVSPANAPAPPTIPGPLQPAWIPLRGLLARFNRIITVGLLPPAARDKLGLRWTAKDELTLRALGRTLSAMNERLPERARYLPIAYAAREAARQQAALKQALATRAM